MNNEDFTRVIKEQLARSNTILEHKNEEYSKGGDRLHNFKVAAELMGVPVKVAVAGMMAKHTASVYDLCMSDKDEDIDIWNEKITDHINYLLILRAVIEPKDVPSMGEGVTKDYSEEDAEELILSWEELLKPNQVELTFKR